MADNNHVSILRQGVGEWNKWRLEHPEVIKPDLSWADLSGLNLMWANLADVDLSWANLSGANLLLANLSKADLNKANLTKTDLTKAILDGAYLHGANLTKAYLFRTSLKEADLTEADLTRAKFESAKLEDARFEKAILNGTDFINSYINNSDFTGAELSNTDFAKSTIIQSNIVETKRSRVKEYAIAAFVIVAFALVGSGFFFLKSIQNEVLFTLPAETHPYVFWKNERIFPVDQNTETVEFKIFNVTPGDYSLKIYPTQLRDFKQLDFTRFKYFSDTIHVKKRGEPIQLYLQLDTLYTVQKLATGRAPNISPDGQRLIYQKTSRAKSSKTVKKSLWLYDLKQKTETKIQISNASLYDYRWEWDRPFLRNNAEKIFLSAYDFKTRKSHAFLIDAETGKMKSIPLKIRKNWLKYLPLDQPRGMIIENKIYSLDGKYVSSFSIGEPYQDALFYGGKKGFVFFHEENVENRRSLMLECTYVNYETLQAKVLFEIPKGKAPFVSAANNADRVILTRYSGLTDEFFSTIQLWSEGVFVNLSNDLLDGRRTYSDGTYRHKTEACADDKAKNVVFEYENNIYLINIPESVTAADLLNAELHDNMFSFAR